jgi:hypothetical protein
MNCDKELNLTHLKPKAQRWRMGLILGLLIIFSGINLGCNKEDDLDEYYVKYEVNSSTIYLGGKLNVTISTENNYNMTLSIDTRVPSETIIGPVEKGFNATLQVVKEGAADSKLTLYTKISVSKNGDPFALKKIDDSDALRNSAQINYTIDY